ncbi:MAG: sensor histidine kinase [Pseudanabaena sp.]
MKTNFISVVSHEFRTPLTTIQSAAELLEHYEWTKEEQTEQLHQIQSEVKHMTELMEDVLFLSRTNANKAKLNITEFDLLKFCKQLLRQIQRTFGKEYNLHSSFHHPVNDISIENPHLQQDIPQFLVHMDEKLLRQILSNLITNDIKYSPKNKDIDFQIIVDQEKIIFIVSDHGIGIPEEDLSHLFSTFHRGKNVGILPGTGLGLSIVKNCVDTLNGLISVKSQLNIGTEFRVTLPIDNHLKT